MANELIHRQMKSGKRLLINRTPTRRPRIRRKTTARLQTAKTSGNSMARQTTVETDYTPQSIWSSARGTRHILKIGNTLGGFCAEGLVNLRDVYSPRNDPDPEMIPNPVMIPKLTPKWYRPRNDPHFSSRRSRDDPHLILGVEWYPRTMDHAKCTTL